MPENTFGDISTLVQVIDGLALQWHHNGHDSVSNHQPYDSLLNHLFRCRSKKTSKLRITGLCAGNSRGTSEFPAQMASKAENVSIWWCHHGAVRLHESLEVGNPFVCLLLADSSSDSKEDQWRYLSLALEKCNICSSNVPHHDPK